MLFTAQILFLFIFGLVFGSFISAYSYRWPRGISINEGRSFCDECRKKIRWYDNIPLFSYILLSGKCRNCRKKVSPRYPLIELSTALLFLAVYTFKGQALQGVALPYFLAISAVLVAVFVIDLEHKLIPDGLVFFILTLSFINLTLSSSDKFYVILFTAFMAALFILFLNFVTKGRGMGLGDVKLVLALGLVFADWKILLIWLFGSFIIGAVVGVFLIAVGKVRFGKQIPFGPFIIISFFIAMFWGNPLANYLFPYL